MHVDVRDIIHQPTGTRTSFTIEGEKPDLSDVILTEPLHGAIHIVKDDDGLVLTGRLTASVELECHRCLRSYVHTLEFPLRAEYVNHASIDEFPIQPDGTLELDEVIRQELLVHLPVRQLCEDDCDKLPITKD